MGTQELKNIISSLSRSQGFYGRLKGGGQLEDGDSWESF